MVHFLFGWYLYTAIRRKPLHSPQKLNILKQHSWWLQILLCCSMAHPVSDANRLHAYFIQLNTKTNTECKKKSNRSTCWKPNLHFHWNMYTIIATAWIFSILSCLFHSSKTKNWIKMKIILRTSFNSNTQKNVLFSFISSFIGQWKCWWFKIHHLSLLYGIIISFLLMF